MYRKAIEQLKAGEISGTVAAVIVRAATVEKTSDYMDGSNSWDLLVAACEDLKNATAKTIETVAENYPAFNSSSSQ